MPRPRFGARAVALACLAPAALFMSSSPPRSGATAPAAVAVAAPGTIAGTVRDSAGAPVAGARIVVVGSGITAASDRRGEYRLVNVPAGLVGLRAERTGFAAAEAESVLVKPHRTTRHDFVLARLAGRTEEVSAAARESRDAAAAPGAVQRSAVAGAPPPHQQQWNTENYARIYDNRFLGARANPLSTFAIDVDRASYGNVRRFLEQGTRPPADAVRIEELINYFPYDYPEPRGEHPFSVTTEVTDAPWRPGHQLVRIGLQGRRIPLDRLPPSNLVFLVDVSGSMMPDNKLPLVKRSLRLLVDQLRPQDRVALVVYAGSAGLVLPSTSGAEKARIHEALDRLAAGGSTAGAAGIRLAYDIAREHHVAGGTNRVVLATDGDFNVGTSSDGELVRLIEERREQGTSLTVLGFGYGNLKDSRLEALADKGNGNYAYVDDILEAQKVLVHELGGTLVTIARDVKIQVEFNPARVRAYRLIGYENRLLAREDFDDDTKDAGELGAGHSVTALYEIVPAGVASDVTIREDSLRYQETRISETAARGGELMLVKLRYKQPEGASSRLLTHAVSAERDGRASADLQFAAAVTAFGMLLRDSEHRGAATWDQVLALARAGRGADPSGYRGEFIRLAELARQLAPAELTNTAD